MKHFKDLKKGISMGDRANVYVVQHGNESSGKGVYLYTHYDGEDLPKILQKALKRGKDRWDDEPYLTRIIFNEMTCDNEMDLTGFGISTYLTDNEHDILVVDVDKQSVGYAKEGEEPKCYKHYSFDKFITLKLSKEQEDEEDEN